MPVVCKWYSSTSGGFQLATYAQCFLIIKVDNDGFPDKKAYLVKNDWSKKIITNAKYFTNHVKKNQQYVKLFEIHNWNLLLKVSNEGCITWRGQEVQKR